MEQGLLPATSPQGRKRSHRFSYFRWRVQIKRNCSHLGKNWENALFPLAQVVSSQRKEEKWGGSITTSDPSFRGSDGERLWWKSKQHLGFDNQTQEAFSTSAHLAATTRSDAGTSTSSCRPRCLRVFPSLSEAPGSVYRISVGASNRHDGGLLPCPLCAFPVLSGKNLSCTALLSLGGEWHVCGSQVCRQEEVPVEVPAEPWPGLRHDLPG